MSIQTWKSEFYPISAEDLYVVLDDPIVLVEHSLRKWTGLLPENLKKHNVLVHDCVLYNNDVDEAGYLDINASSCALCCAYYDDDDVSSFNARCLQCPLYNYLGHRCDGIDNPDAPYTIFSIESSDGVIEVQPMIDALQGTLKMLKEEHAK